MQFFLDAFRWLLDPANYAAGSVSPLPIQARIGEHLWYTGVSVAIATIIALPLGLYIGHTGRGRQFVISFTGAMRALPTLGLLMALFLIVGATVPFTQAAFVASIIALVILAIPSIFGGRICRRRICGPSHCGLRYSDGDDWPADPPAYRDSAVSPAHHRWHPSCHTAGNCNDRYCLLHLAWRPRDDYFQRHRA